jgi:hypothetical protein
VLNVIMLSVIMLSVVMLNVIMMSVVAPKIQLWFQNTIWIDLDLYTKAFCYGNFRLSLPGWSTILRVKQGTLTEG